MWILPILGATPQKHVRQYEKKYPQTAEELLKNTYVDHVQSGIDAKEELLKFQQEATEILAEDGFHLHTWHSNVLEVEKQIQNRTEKHQAVSPLSNKLGTDYQTRFEDPGDPAG